MAENLDRIASRQFGESGEHARIARIDETEDDGDDHRSDHHGHDEHSAQEPYAAKLALAEESKGEPQHGFNGDREADKAHRDQKRVEKLAIGPELQVVIEADIAQRLAVTIELGARFDAVPQGIDENDEGDEKARRKKQVGQGQIEPCPLKSPARDDGRGLLH
jgi:hypothetical protein